MSILYKGTVFLLLQAEVAGQLFRYYQLYRWNEALMCTEVQGFNRAVATGVIHMAFIERTACLYSRSRV